MAWVPVGSARGPALGRICCLWLFPQRDPPSAKVDFLDEQVDHFLEPESGAPRGE